MTLDSAPVSPRIAINPRADGFDRLDFRELFGNDRPVVVEIGSGKGRFLLEAAKARPELNFIGIEKSLHYHRYIAARITRHGATNIRLINHDAHAVLEAMLPDASVREMHIYFPDPWPRPRERKRRIIRPEAVREMARVLEPGGTGCYVTDFREYFEKAVPVLAELFEIEAGEVTHTPPRTNYEAKYQTEGRPIFQVEFRHRAE